MGFPGLVVSPLLKGFPQWVLVGLLFYCPLLGTFLARSEVGGFEVVFDDGVTELNRGF